MDAWYLLNYQARIYNKVLNGLAGLAIECYSPKKMVLKARADKKNCKRVREEPLFEGYLFVRFDPELVHTTKITQRPGVNYFVRFGGEPKVIPEDVINALQMECDTHPVYCTDDKIAKIPSELHKTVAGMTELDDKDARVKELLNYLNAA